MKATDARVIVAVSGEWVPLKSDTSGSGAPIGDMRRSRLVVGRAAELAASQSILYQLNQQLRRRGVDDDGTTTVEDVDTSC
jgi:hypothetical protein